MESLPSLDGISSRPDPKTDKTNYLLTTAGRFSGVLSLPLENKNGQKLTELLNHFMKGKVHSSNENRAGDAIKRTVDGKEISLELTGESKTQLATAPDSIVLELKREQKGKSKINASVTVDRDLKVTLSSEHCADEQSRTYDIKGFITHDGDGTGGHYMAYIKEADGTYSIYNDEKVTHNVSEKDFLKGSEKASLFFLQAEPS